MAQKYSLTKDILIRVYNDFLKENVYNVSIGFSFLEYCINKEEYNLQIKSDRSTFISVNKINTRSIK